MYREEGFCPFFIGCGFGGSWYQAKSTEIPVDLQYEILKNPQEMTELTNSINDGTLREELNNEDSPLRKEFNKIHKDLLKETPFEEMTILDGDIMNAWLSKRIRQFNQDYVVKYTQNEENAEKTIKPVVDSRLVLVLTQNAKIPYSDVSEMPLQRKLDTFYEYTGIEKKIDIYTAEEYNKLNPSSTAVETKENPYEIEEQETEEDKEKKAILYSIKEKGYYLFSPMATDIFNEDYTMEELNAMKKLVVDINKLDSIKANIEIFNNDGKGYKLYMCDVEKDKYFTTPYHIKDGNLTKFRQFIYK